jgi:ABC-type multidrug transport system fused ATPase/permease subunit
VNTIKNFIKKYFQTFVYFYKRLRYRLFLRVGLSIGVGVLDGFGLAMFLPLLQMADGSHSDGKALGNLQFLVTGMNSIGLSLNLLNILIIMSLFFILKGAAQYISGIYEVTLRQFFIKKIRVNLSYALSRMQYKEFVTSDAGRIQNTMSGEVNKISQAYQNYFSAFQQAVMVAVYMLFAFFVDAKFALLICVGGGLTNFLFRSIYRATKASSKKLVVDSNLYQSLILQFTTNFKYLKATGYIKEYNEKLIGVIEYIEDSTRRIGKLGSIVGATREPILILVVSTVIFVQVNIMGGALGTILVSLLFFYRALAALIQMQSSYNNFLSNSGSMDNMTDFENEINRAKEKTGKIQFSKFNSNFAVRDGHFSYGEKVILKDINVNILRNQTIAFVGESGSGKTTLVNIVSGLMPLTQGEMLVDGIKMSDINLESFGKRIGYITQEPVIFGDNIFNNITLWAEPTKENYDRFNNAILQASIADFIEEQPLKEKSMLGNNGINLSGGQKQRISIARELYKDVDLLVLDEATSALDSETEKVIQRGIEELHGKYTILIVAHRLSTIKNADHIIVLDKGEIIDQGTFSELSSHSTKFKKMVEYQQV